MENELSKTEFGFKKIRSRMNEAYMGVQLPVIDSMIRTFKASHAMTFGILSSDTEKAQIHVPLQKLSVHL